MRSRIWSCVLALGLLLGGCGDDDDDGNGGDAGATPMDGGGDGDGDAGGDAGGDGDGDADAVARGRYLVEHVADCVGCHTPRGMDGRLDESKLLSGVECFIDVVPEDDDAGCIHTRNLTNHETGLANRSDDEIKDMFMKGERPDGTFLHPIMPYWALGNMTDEDADAIVAFLRTVDGVDHMLPDSQAPFDNVEAAAPTFPEALIPMPGDDYEDRDAALRGRYLAGNVGICMECHMPRDEMDRPIADKAFQGGNAFPTALLGLPPVFPEVIFAPNITPHENGIGDATVAELVAVLAEGTDLDGTPLCPPMDAGPMGAFGGMTEGDMQDIAHYLRSIPAGDNEVPGECTPPGPPMDDGGTEDGGL